jgi:Hydantoinase/oxoprolinase N-terminal region/Hydantoinase B/oxoprolinase/Hydantoinase/oxoprolinase
MYRVGVDIGGTFTDFALFDPRGRKMSVHKRLTTPHDPSEAVIAGVKALLALDNVAIADVGDIVHGTTLVTNAVIERRGAVTGMLATAGFSDILDMGFERRYDLFDLRVKYPAPLVPRRLRLEVAERVRFDGSIELPLDEAAVRTAARQFRDLDVAAVAVCFLHSYANPAHETRAAQILREEASELFVSSSAEVFPNMREFERWTTTTVNAFTQPMFDRYLDKLEKGLASQGFHGRLYIMSSSGGTLSADTARRFPVRALESGPAAGALMSAYLGRSLELANLLSFDMGGTTIKSLLLPSIPNNAGSIAPISVFAPPGCILNAQPPFATGGRHAMGHFVTPLVYGALAQALPERVQAGSGMMNLITFQGTRRDERPFSTLYFAAGGYGALDGLDGWCTLPHPSNMAAVPVEVWETLTHTTIESKRLIPDSGGPGRWRGGLGQEVVIRNDTHHPVVTLGMGNRTLFPARGLFGGGDGALRTHAIDGREVHAKGRNEIAPGQRMRLVEAGGGGFGDPRLRAPSAVAEDVAQGYVSAEMARGRYGFVA